MNFVFFLVVGIVVGTIIDGLLISYACPKVMSPQDGWQDISPVESFQYAAMASFLGALIGYFIGILGLLAALIFYFWLFTQNMKMDNPTALKATGVLLVGRFLTLGIVMGVQGFFASL